MTNIGDYAFYLCYNLTSITIPNSVKSIGKKAFDEIAVSTIVSLIENPFAIYGSISSYKTFTLNTFNNAMLYVPTGTINKYKATEGWKDFNNIIEGVPSGIKGVHLDSDKDYPVYDINGRRLETPQRGINIINGKKVVIKWEKNQARLSYRNDGRFLSGSLPLFFSVRMIITFLWKTRWLSS